MTIKTELETQIKNKKINPFRLSAAIIIVLILSFIIFVIFQNSLTDETPFEYPNPTDIKPIIIVGQDKIISIRNTGKTEWTPKDTIMGKGVLFVINIDYSYLYPKAVKKREIIRILLEAFASDCDPHFQWPLESVGLVGILCREGNLVKYMNNISFINRGKKDD